MALRAPGLFRPDAAGGLAPACLFGAAGATLAELGECGSAPAEWRGAVCGEARCDSPPQVRMYRMDA